MSSSRLIYDGCVYDKSVYENKSILDYQLYTGYAKNARPCQMELGIVEGNDVGRLGPGRMTNIESDLRGLDRNLSGCIKDKYKPSCSGCPKCLMGFTCSCVECQMKGIKHPRPLKSCNMFEAKPPMPKKNYQPAKQKSLWEWLFGK